jgi:hypothetical protein
MLNSNTSANLKQIEHILDGLSRAQMDSFGQTNFKKNPFKCSFTGKILLNFLNFNFDTVEYLEQESTIT